MFSSILFAGLLAASAFASPDVETPTALEKRADRKYCGAVVTNAEPPNQYCYQFCDLEVNKIIGAKPVVVSGSTNCQDGPEGGCPITILNQMGIEKSTTETTGTTEVKQVDGKLTFFGVSVGSSYQKWIEKSHASTFGETKTNASTNWLYVPRGKTGHVVFFPYFEEHCGPSTIMRKPNLHDETNFDCNPDYNILIDHDADLTRIRGMKYTWGGVKPDDIYRFDPKVCIRLPMTSKLNGQARGQYQICDTENTNNSCKECIGCDANVE